MHLIVQSNTVVDCSAAQAFALVANMERFPEWFPKVIAITSSNELAHGEVGKQYRETVVIPLRGQRQIMITVKEVAANQLFITEGRFPPLLPRMEVRFTELGPQQTAIDWRMLSRSQSPWVRHLLLPLARRTLKRRAEQGMNQLKARLEGRA